MEHSDRSWPRKTTDGIGNPTPSVQLVSAEGDAYRLRIRLLGRGSLRRSGTFLFRGGAFRRCRTLCWRSAFRGGCFGRSALMLGPWRRVSRTVHRRGRTRWRGCWLTTAHGNQCDSRQSKKFLHVSRPCLSYDAGRATVPLSLFRAWRPTFIPQKWLIFERRESTKKSWRDS